MIVPEENVNLIIGWDEVSDVSDHESLSGLEIQDVGWANSRVRACKHHKLKHSEDSLGARQRIINQLGHVTK